MCSGSCPLPLPHSRLSTGLPPPGSLSVTPGRVRGPSPPWPLQTYQKLVLKGKRLTSTGGHHPEQGHFHSHSPPGETVAQRQPHTAPHPRACHCTLALGVSKSLSSASKSPEDLRGSQGRVSGRLSPGLPPPGSVCFAPRILGALMPPPQTLRSLEGLGQSRERRSVMIVSAGLLREPRPPS